MFPPGVFLVRSSAVEEVGLFDPRVTISNDWDFLMRLTRVGSLQFIDEVLLHYRRHEFNMGAGPATRAATALVRRKTFHSPENAQHDRRIVRSAWRAAQTVSARAHWDRLRTAGAQRNLRGGVDTVSRLGLAAGRFVVGRPMNPRRELGQ